ncbi:MAG: class I SAM-dependent methyltransferase [Gammaproteobacteria bacterium]|nr:class I SAM-dependent methyltransferase [Gammaproteobacteria bacterium]
MNAIDLAERGFVPTPLIRFGIRRLLRQRASWCRAHRGEQLHDLGNSGPIALATDAANRQHYEVPTAFYRLMLGPRMKYSCCWFDDAHDAVGDAALARAEQRMLQITCENAALGDGQRILELGCGWGSLSIYMAEHFPASNILAVSNSRTQRAYIEDQARSRGLDNLEVLTADVNELANHLDAGRCFDRVVSVEMFEHMRNWSRLLSCILDRWLAPDGRLFLHYFCHRHTAYPFEDDRERGDGNWMARHFFTGGMMPSEAMLDGFDGLEVLNRHVIPGTHYARTLNAWLHRLDVNRPEALKVLAGSAVAGGSGAPVDTPVVRFNRWRMFLLACAELFDYAEGREWYVTHRLAGRP